MEAAWYEQQLSQLRVYEQFSCEYCTEYGSVSSVFVFVGLQHCMYKFYCMVFVPHVGTHMTNAIGQIFAVLSFVPPPAQVFVQ